MKDGRKMFFSGLLAALLIVTNIVAVKVTVIAQLPLSCSIFVYPFTFLCTAIITELYGAKEARKSVYSALAIQLLMLILYIVVINMPNQIYTINEANALQTILASVTSGETYLPEFKTIIASLIGFGASQLINIGLYSFARKNTFKIVSVALSVLIAMIVDTAIYILITETGVLAGNELVLAVIYRFVADVVATIVIIPLFMLFSIKKKEEIKTKTKKATA